MNSHDTVRCFLMAKAPYSNIDSDIANTATLWPGLGLMILMYHLL